MTFYFEDIGLLIQIIVVTILMYSAFMVTLNKFTHKLLYSAFSLFFLLYNGIGIAYVKGVYEYMFFYYIIFYLSFSTSYLFFLRLFYKESIHIQKAIYKPLSRIADNRTFAIGILSLYLFTKFLPLVYPEFLAYRLLKPPPPDILGEFMSRYETTHPVKKLSDNLGYLVYPFYLLSLYTFRKNIGLLIFALLAPLYFEYAYHAYLHRSALLFPILTVFVIIGQYYKRIRLVFFASVIFIFPLFIGLLFQYQSLRQGDKVETVKMEEGASELFFMETSFVRHSSRVIKSDKHINLGHYYLWMFTLPIPKIIIGEVPAVSASFEMSEIIIGEKIGSKRFYAELAGLLTESVYIYGQLFFFLHAIMIGGIIAFLARITDRSPVLLGLLVFFAVMCSYNLNRAGISSFLPKIINKLFIFYLLLLFFYVRKRIKI